MLICFLKTTVNPRSRLGEQRVRKPAPGQNIKEFKEETKNGREYDIAVNSVVDVLLLGHSFIGRLQNEIYSIDNPNLHVNMHATVKVHFVSHDGGWSRLPDYEKFLGEVMAKLPQIRCQAAVIRISDNDISNKCCPLLWLPS